MTFGEKIRQLRKEKKLTLRTLAKRSGINFTYLSKIENGRFEYTPSVSTIRALAKELETDELELLQLANKLPSGIEVAAKYEEGRVFLRTASQKLRTAKDWQALLDYLEKSK